MSPSRNPDSTFTLEDQPASSSSSSSSPTIPRGRIKKRAVFVPLTTDGKLDVDRVRDTSELEQARSALGVVDPATIPPPEAPKIRKEFILPAYSVLEVLIRLAGRKLLKWPDELTSEMRFDEKKKEALVEPTAAVISKYCPSWLIENQDIAALAAVLTDAVDDMVNQGVVRYVAKVRAGQQAPPQAGQVEPPQGRNFVPVQPSNGVSVAA